MDRSRSFLLWAILPLCIVPVWMAGGTFRAWQWPFLPLCAWAWFAFFAAPATSLLPSRRQRLVALLRDPAVWAALVFFILLLLQTWNSGRIRMIDFETGDVVYSPPRHRGWPWSFVRTESEEMIRWFAPVITVFLLIRHGGSAVPRDRVLSLVCVNGLFNAFLAFVHLHLGWVKMYDFQPFGHDVYGSFGYPNHGAIYFVLLTSLALGLLLRELFRERAERSVRVLVLSALCVPVFFLAASFSTSRAGILGAWLAVGGISLSVGVIAWPRRHPVQRVLGVVALAVVGAALAAGFFFFAKPIHLRELAAATTQLDVGKEISSRWFQVESAWRMWLDHPVYGVGGWGYRYLAAFYLPESQWALLEGPGKANVHNDLMQFLVEFGLIGFICLAIMFAPALFHALRGLFRPPTEDDSLWASPLRIGAFVGLFLLFLVNLFDIPLRSPAVFIHGILLLSLLPPHESDPSIWPPIVDWTLLQPAALRVSRGNSSPLDNEETVAEEYEEPS